MAQAAKFTETREVERIVKDVISEERVSLTLSMAEARTLLAIAAKVSGSPKDATHGDNPSPRMHMDSISEAIGKATGIYYGDTPEFRHMSGYINFASYEDYQREHWQ